MHFAKVKVAQSADRTFAALATILKDRRYDLQTVDQSDRVLTADQTDARGWFASMLSGLTLGLVGQVKSVRVTARVDEDGDNAMLSIEARQLYGWPAPYDFAPLVSDIVNELGRRLGLGAAIG